MGEDATRVQSECVDGIKHCVDIPECSLQEKVLTNAWFLVGMVIAFLRLCFQIYFCVPI